MILVAIVAALIGSTGGYLWQTTESPESSFVSIQEQKRNKSETPTKYVPTNLFVGAAKYNCEKSGGSFSNNTCVCPEEGETQEIMYDKNTGYCQTAYGGPGGDAFAASIGLPYGAYAYYNDIVAYNCEQTGGVFIHNCNCLDYDKSTGYCK